MGSIISHGRNNEGVEQMDYSENNAYKYPPKTGSYFGSHFFMGGERFEAVQPEAFLFGDNMDLNFLGSRPYPFPYHVTVGSEPSKALRGYVNVRKDSLKFVKVPVEGNNEDGEERTKCTLEFVIDADLPFCLVIHMFAQEETTGGVLHYTTANRTFTSHEYRFPAGYGQVFRKDDFYFSPFDYDDDDWLYRPGCDVLPLVIHCYIEKEHLTSYGNVSDMTSSLHGQVTILALERSSESFYSLRLLKQKQIIDGLPYLLEEIYGLEEWNRDQKEDGVDAADGSDGESSTDCVVCMSEMRDTLILPCRHMCLCSTCAESLRYQASACPICRAPFRALLQVRGLRRIIPLSAGRSGLSSANIQQCAVGDHLDPCGNEASDGEAERVDPEPEDDEGPSQTTSTPSREVPLGCRSLTASPLPSKPAPPGYEAVPLMELLSSGYALPISPPRTNPFTMSPDGESTHLDQLLGRSQAYIRRSRSGITSGDGGSLRGSASLLRSSRRSVDGELCNLSIESGSLRSRSSKKKGNKKSRNKPAPLTSIPSTDVSSKAIMAATLLSPRSIDLSVAGASGVSGDCEVIELTPSSVSQENEDPPTEAIKIEMEESADGFCSVELRAPGAKNSISVDLETLDNVADGPIDMPQSPNPVSQSEEDSSLSSTTSGRALLSGRTKPF